MTELSHRDESSSEQRGSWHVRKVSERPNGSEPTKVPPEKRKAKRRAQRKAAKGRR